MDEIGTILPADTVSKIIHIGLPKLRATANMLEKEIESADVGLAVKDTAHGHAPSRNGAIHFGPQLRG